MALTKIIYGTLADPDVINNNFDYLDERVDDAISKIYTNNAGFDSKLSNLQSYLEVEIEDSKTETIEELDKITANISTVNERIDKIVETKYSAPEKVALIDWETMGFKANVADVRNINNTTTGIKAYGGDYGLLRTGDIYLKEEFTKYPRIMIVWSDDGGNHCNSTIWETWDLDNLLSLSKGRTSLIKCQAGTYYWNVWGYEYSYIVSNVTYKTTKKYFSVNGQQNCSIIEIYGLRG